MGKGQKRTRGSSEKKAAVKMLHVENLITYTSRSVCLSVWVCGTYHFNGTGRVTRTSVKHLIGQVAFIIHMCKSQRGGGGKLHDLKICIFH